MSKAGIVKTLKEYFESKGKVLSYEEYLQADDAPIRPHLIKRYVGKWNRLENYIGDITPVEVVEKPAPKVVNNAKK